MQEKLIIRGAREHNLKDISLDLPRDSLIVFTGLSGSGKSSLAFDTIFAEGQRRYVESLSAYARQFLGQMDKPDVDFIEGLSPAVSIDQKSTSKNPRSTVGTITEVYDYLRLLYARAGRPHCPVCHSPIERQTPQQIVDRVMALDEGTRFQVLAPVIRGRKGEYIELFRQLQTQGFSRARVNGETHPLERPSPSSTSRRSTPSRWSSTGSRSRRRPSAGSPTRSRPRSTSPAGLVTFDLVDLPAKDPGRELKFSEKMACPNDHPIDTDELEPRSFSFNSPFGACPECSGLGTRMEVDPELVVPDAQATLGEGAIQPWSQAHVADYFLRLMNALGEELGFDLNTPWEDLPAKAQKSILDGHSTKVHVVTRNRYGRERAYWAEFEGVRTYIERRHREAESDTSRERFEGFMREVPCPACQGSRLKPVSMAVTLGDLDAGGKNIAEVCALPINETADFLREIELTARERQIGERVLKEIQERLNFLLDVGLDYLSLDRPSGSLSGGEAQRIRLATQIGAGLVGVLYVLDEPSIGLHQRDNHRLIETLVRLKDLGNTLIIVEHDEDTIEAADWVVDIGPGAGEHGGQVVHSGTVDGPARAPRLDHRSIPLRPPRDPGPADPPAAHDGPRADRGRRPRAQPAQHRRELPARAVRRGHRRLGLGQVHAGQRHPLHVAGQADLPRAGDPRPAPADHRPRPRRQGDPRRPVADRPHAAEQPRDLHRRLRPHPQAVRRRRPRRRCAATSRAGSRSTSRAAAARRAAGDGTIKIEMNFLPDVYVPCEVCHGARYNRETLEVHYKGKTIAEVLDMPIEEAVDFFAAVPAINRHMKTLVEVGLGYVRLGQPATTLSGGEAQRVKLSSELQKRSTGRTVYVLDEPTTGLHFEDIRKLLLVLGRLVDQGNTVLVIEHNLDVIKTADWIVDMGPEGGSRGGLVVAEGTPEQVADNPASFTGAFLKPLLDGREAKQPTRKRPAAKAPRRQGSPKKARREADRSQVGLNRPAGSLVR